MQIEQDRYVPFSDCAPQFLNCVLPCCTTTRTHLCLLLHIVVQHAWMEVPNYGEMHGTQLSKF